MLIKKTAMSKMSMAAAVRAGESDPGWALSAYPHRHQMQALQWKLLNLTKLRRSGKRS